MAKGREGEWGGSCKRGIGEGRRHKEWRRHGAGGRGGWGGTTSKVDGAGDVKILERHYSPRVNKLSEYFSVVHAVM